MDRILFTVNRYDSDGDLSEEGIWLHVGDLSIKAGDDLHDLDKIIENLQSIRQEIEENYDLGD